MFLCSFSQCQRDKFRSLIHTQHGRITAVAVILSSTRTTRRAGRFRSISIDNASRLQSSTTLNVRKRRPQTSSGSALPAWPVARDCVPAAVVYPYGENSAWADSKYGGAFCDSTRIPAAVSRLPVVPGGFRNTGLPVDIFNSPSGFDWSNHSDDLVRSKTGFTHSDLLRWQIDYVGWSLNVNGSIMRDTYIFTRWETFSSFVRWMDAAGGVY